MSAAVSYRSIRIIAILVLSIIGFFTARMPWLEYPLMELVLEGRHGVGWFTSTLFFIIFVLAFIMLIFKVTNRVIAGSIFGLGSFLTIVGLDKIIRFFLVWKHQSSDVFLFDMASAGVMLRYGVYVLSISAGLITILSSPLVFTSILDQGRSWSTPIRIGALIVLIVGLIIGYAVMRPAPVITEAEVIENINEDYTSMNRALMESDFETVVNHTHPNIYQSLGGIEKYKEVLGQVRVQAMRVDSRVDDIIKYQQKGAEVQAIFHHTTVFNTPKGNESSRGSSFGFSHDGGKSWVFAGINGKSFAEMKKTFPDIFNELDYSVGQNESN